MDKNTYYCLLLNKENGKWMPLDLLYLRIPQSSEKMEFVDRSFTELIQGQKFVVAQKFRGLRVLKLYELLSRSIPQSPLPQDKDELLEKAQGITDDWSKTLTRKCWVVSPAETFADIKEKSPEPSSSILLVAQCEVDDSGLPGLGVIDEDAGRRRNRSKTVYNDDNVANTIKQKALSPSAGAKNEMMMKTQHPDTAGAIYNGRPSGLTGPSISIYHSVFSKFHLEFAEVPPPGQIPAKDLLFANKFVENSLRYYSSEAERQIAIAYAIEAFLGSGTFKPTTFFCAGKTFVPDGVKYVRIETGKTTGIDVFVFLGQLKNGSGLGDSDPMDQVEKSYLLGCVNPESAPLRRTSCMPTFLLTISGPHIMVSGAVYLNGVVSQRLTDFISLVPPLMAGSMVYQSNHDFLVHRIAHLFRTLRRCIDVLEDEYTHVALPVELDENVMSPAPHFSSFESDGKEHKVIYRYCLFKTYSDRTVFSADVRDSSGKTVNCIVKFASRYCSDAHHLVHEMGVAPRLLYCNFEPTVGRVCVVMERIQEQEQDSGGRPQVSKSGFNKLKEALLELHKRSYVFGDLRSANIIVDANHWPYLVDFDWSGKEGEVTYPTNINMDIRWADGIKCGYRIISKHDEDMLELYRGEIDIV